MKATNRKCVSLLLAISCLFFIFPASACTIFVLTDSERTLFFNNEDWSDPATRIWFQPGGEGYFGAAYVGFDNGWAQGGVNTEGLAFDWVAGYKAEWTRDASLRAMRGNPSQRMLETCATVDDAIAFYKKNWEPGFSYARIMVADKSGTSVIISANEGQLVFDISEESRGFGYGAEKLRGKLAGGPSPSIAQGIPILQACMQQGQYATKYSSIYDLKSGKITLINFVDQGSETTLNFMSELAKGAHFYAISEAARQATEKPVPLERNMKRFPADEYKPVAGGDPAVTQHIQNVLQNAATQGLREEDFTAEFWQAIAPEMDGIKQEIASLGKLISIAPVMPAGEKGEDEHYFRIEYERAIVVQVFKVDGQNRISLIRPEVAEAIMQ